MIKRQAKISKGEFGRDPSTFTRVLPASSSAFHRTLVTSITFTRSHAILCTTLFPLSRSSPSTCPTHITSPTVRKKKGGHFRHSHVIAQGRCRIINNVVQTFKN